MASRSPILSHGDGRKLIMPLYFKIFAGGRKWNEVTLQRALVDVGEKRSWKSYPETDEMRSLES